MVYLKSVENVITLGKLIGLLFLFCLPLLSILFLKTKRNDLARPVMGTIFLVRLVRVICHAPKLKLKIYFSMLYLLLVPELKLTKILKSIKNKNS